MYIESYMLIVGSFLNLTIGVFGMFYQANKALNLNMAVPTTKEENEKIGYNECFEGNLFIFSLYKIVLFGVMKRQFQFLVQHLIYVIFCIN